MADDLPWLSLTEAAAVSGLARETVRARARRGLIPSRKGNDGRVVVQVQPGAAPTPEQGMHADIDELLAEVSELREALARAMSERDAAKAVASAMADAKDELITELKLMLAEARRPWWRRWRS